MLPLINYILPEHTGSHVKAKGRREISLYNSSIFETLFTLQIYITEMLCISTIYRDIRKKILVFGVAETDAYLHKHNDFSVAPTGRNCTINLGMWTILIYILYSWVFSIFALPQDTSFVAGLLQKICHKIWELLPCSCGDESTFALHYPIHLKLLPALGSTDGPLFTTLLLCISCLLE